MSRSRWRNPGFIAVLAAWALAVLACLPLRYPLTHDSYVLMPVLDITRSMNVQDVQLDGRPASRLQLAKASLRRSLGALPCGSRIGLAVFTERRPFVLFEPVEVCQGYAAIDGAIAQIDWRMAWEADSRIADSLRNSLELLKGADARVVFISDGHEAPPANPRYRPSFAALKGQVQGVIVGVGGAKPVPIPKFNEQGEAIGFYAEDEVPHRSTFGEPETAPELAEGYHARNAPFGDAPTGGTEHLSALKETYLRQLANASGLHYQRLETPDNLLDAMRQAQWAKPQRSTVDIRWIPAGLAGLILLGLYLYPLVLWFPRSASKPLT